MKTVIVSIVLLAIIGGAAFYIYKQKKSGAKCIGCPHSKSCRAHCSGTSCGCGSSAEE